MLSYTKESYLLKPRCEGLLRTKRIPLVETKPGAPTVNSGLVSRYFIACFASSSPPHPCTTAIIIIIMIIIIIIIIIIVTIPPLRFPPR
ncbi:hypothetical protein EYF80_018151 [Liparis tanakae]|uniref:Uncharacterized protein n=1 Tax=Liparis tanakae TaxID=230148 RepID=A0A4Z2I0Q8_9TELE|nr:hypothetical protein EYF80_018151 [Liparis tanakae]